MTVVVQAIATVFFLADAVIDITYGMDSAGDLHHEMELLIAVALLLGVATGIWQYRRILLEAQRREATVMVARGALAEMVEQRFAEWRLTEAECEVALFALKGCDVAEIAAMRKSAHSTVRAQLSRVYAKAEVSGQPMLIGVFVDELLDLTPSFALDAE